MDVDRRQVHRGHAGANAEEVAQVIGDMDVEFFGEIARQIPQERIGTSVLHEELRIHEEGITKIQNRADRVAVVIQPLEFRGDQGVAEAIGRARELNAQSCINTAVMSLVVADRIAADQFGQEFVVGDLCNLSANDGSGVLIELVATPFGVLLAEIPNQAVVLSNEEGL